jgi:hypothetical protein
MSLGVKVAMAFRSEFKVAPSVWFEALELAMVVR